MQKSIGFNLTSLSDERLTIDRIEQFIQITFDFLEHHDIELTYWGVDGKGFSSKLLKFTPKKLQNLKEKKNYLDKDGKIIEGLDFVINPLDSDSPAFDKFFYVTLSYSEPLKRLEITLTLNPNEIPIKKNQIGKLLQEYAKIFVVDFGFIYEHENFTHVNAVVLQYDDDSYREIEYQIFLRWYKLSKEEKLENIRDLYPVNLLRKKLYHDNISKILDDNKEFFEFYHYKGDGFVEIDTELKYLECLVDKSYLEYCE